MSDKCCKCREPIPAKYHGRDSLGRDTYSISAEKKAECWKMPDCNCPCHEVESLREQLAASEARVAELREALRQFIENSSCQTNQPNECEFAERVLASTGGSEHE